MQGAGAMLAECILVEGRPVALVLKEAVQRKSGILLPHEAIPRDFGDDGSCRNAFLRLITANDGRVREVKPEFIPSIDEEICGSNFLGEHCDCFLHCAFRCSENPFPINNLRLHETYSIGAVCCEVEVRNLTFFRREHLGIRNASAKPSPHFPGTDTRCSNDRSCERPTTYLINAGDDCLVHDEEVYSTALIT